jgi:hypothetical protein
MVETMWKTINTNGHKEHNFHFFNHGKLGEELVFEIRQPKTVAKFIDKSSLSVPLLNL